MDKDYIDRWQSDLVYTKESVLPVCDKPYHTNNWILQKGEEIEVLRNCALRCWFFTASCIVLQFCQAFHFLFLYLVFDLELHVTKRAILLPLNLLCHMINPALIHLLLNRQCKVKGVAQWWPLVERCHGNLKMLCLYLLGQNCLHYTFKPYLTYFGKYEKLPNIVIHACKNKTEKMNLLKVCGPQIRLCLFTFQPNRSEKFNSLTTIVTLIWLGGAEVTHPLWVQEVLGSIPRSGKGFYVDFCFVVVVYFFV